MKLVRDLYGEFESDHSESIQYEDYLGVCFSFDLSSNILLFKHHIWVKLEERVEESKGSKTVTVKE